jgi:hypothetical protein
MTSEEDYSRREILAGLGTVGVGIGVSTVLFTGRSRAFTTYTRVPMAQGRGRGQQGPPEGVPQGPPDDSERGPPSSSGSTTEQQDQHGLRVAWWESYNGRVVETQGDGSETDASRVLDDGSPPTFVPEVTGPVVSVGNVLPGDEGVVGIGIEADVPGNEEVAVWFRTRLVSTSENGINEPESKHPDENPDDPDDGGEMDDLTEVTVWENAGLAGLGVNDGRIVPVVESVVGEGSLREVFAESDLADGIELDCLEDGGTTYLAMRWELPDTVGNVVQSDSATFDLEFRAARCDAGNPFEEPEDEDGTEGEAEPGDGGENDG